eukprot:GHVP01044082.1.p1 GENE.GHVP01044082.1~~GHVP01044082.1.p1  ORF type:complete len:313 (+),score=49.75 GHVP01044082.1:60-998(+)
MARPKPPSLRRGFLFHVGQASINSSSGNSRAAALALHLCDASGKTFRIYRPFCPYFLIALRSEIVGVPELDIGDMNSACVNILEKLVKELGGEGASIMETKKINLSKRHITGDSEEIYRFSNYQKLTFASNDGLLAVKRRLNSQVAQNNRVMKRYEETLKQISLSSQFSREKTTLNIDSDPLLLIEDIFESDVAYAQRGMIDCNILCGKWYDIFTDYTKTEDHPERNRVSCSDEEIQKKKPPLRVLAYDIETSKEALKFPIADKDEVMLISYVIDGNGYLIVNRQWIAKEINNFDYSPLYEYSTSFQFQIVW